MSMCRVFSCVVGRGCFLWPVCSLGKTLLAFSLLHSIFQGQICLLPQMFLYFLLLYSTPLWWKGHLFWGVSSKRSCRFKFSHGQLHVVSSCLPCGTNIASTFVFSASHLFPAIKKKKLVALSGCLSGSYVYNQKIKMILKQARGSSVNRRAST